MRLPTDQQHITIVGQNGSGKTQFALWLLAQRDFLTRPWLIYNFKDEESIDNIPGAIQIGVDQIPEGVGLSIVKPLPHEKAEVEAQLWAIWKRGNTGIYIDEGYMIDRYSAAFPAILTQGRSKYIPVMTLSQRPMFLNGFVFTESKYFTVFDLQYRKDRQRMMEYIPADLDKPLPEYHSYYYDVKARELKKLSPVPTIDEIYAVFERRLRTRREAV